MNQDDCTKPDMQLVSHYVGLTDEEAARLLPEHRPLYLAPLEVTALDDATAEKHVDPAHPDFDELAQFAAFLRLRSKLAP